MQSAKAAGCKVAVGGTGMLMWQGAAAFNLFTGKDMPTKGSIRTVLQIKRTEFAEGVRGSFIPRMESAEGALLTRGKLQVSKHLC